MKAVILARVSTAEQQEGHSIKAQHDRLVEYCQRKGLEIAQAFELIESSTRGERKEFNKILQFCRNLHKKEKKPVALVADAVDRVQRSFKESTELDDLIKKEMLELHFYREGRVIGKNASAMDIMLWDFSVMGAKSYVLQLSENVKRSMDWKIKNGEWPHMAPLGYLNADDLVTGKKTVTPDPLKGPMVRRVFQEYATGGFTVGEMLLKAQSWGLTSRMGNPLSKSVLHEMIRNPFYIGQMRYNGKTYPHSYELLISREVFERCQKVLAGWNRPDFKYSDKPFIFRGLIRCAITGRTITCDQKKGYLTYLIATDPSNAQKRVYVREEEVMGQMEKAFETFAIDEKVRQGIVTHLRESHRAEKRFHNDMVEDLQARLRRTDERLQKAMDLLLDGAISPDDHARTRQRLSEERDDLMAQLYLHQKADDGFRQAFERTMDFTIRAAAAFKSSNTDQKRAFINLAFSNLTLRGARLSYTLNFPFSAFAELRECPEWLPKLDEFRTNIKLRQGVIEAYNMLKPLSRGQENGESWV